jgi:prepilin-type N-terminal cleavage/methylation domain-containing protein
MRIRRGFTLVELMIVMGLLGILASVVLNNFIGTIAKGRDARRKDDLKQIAKGLEAFATDFGGYPASEDGKVMGCRDAPGTEFFACGEGISDRFRVYRETIDEPIVYLNTWPRDPDSQKEYIYVYDSTNGGFALYASLENTNDRDVKVQANGQPDPAGWGISCGSTVCNYKMTDYGVVKR